MVNGKTNYTGRWKEIILFMKDQFYQTVMVNNIYTRNSISYNSPRLIIERGRSGSQSMERYFPDYSRVLLIVANHLKTDGFSFQRYQFVMRNGNNDFR